MFRLRITLKKHPILVLFSISDFEVDLVSQMSDLGVILDTQLTFPNNDSVVRLENRALGLLVRSGRGIRGYTVIHYATRGGM